MIRKALALLLVLLPAAAGAVTLNFPAPATPAARHDEALGSYDLPVGPWRGGKIDTLHVEGPLTRIAWRLNTATLTTLQVLKSLRDQLLKQGFAVLYECDTRDCGGFDFRYDTFVLPEPEMHVDLGDFRYLAAERPDAKGLQYVSLLVSRSAADAFVQMIQVGRDPAVAPPPDAAGGTTPNAALAKTPAAVGAATAETTPAAMGKLLLSQGSVALDDLRFDSGSSELSPGEYPSLAALAAWLKANPNRDVTLVGHTDDSGGLAANIALSRRRADSVLQRLVTRYGVDKGQLDAEGVGYLAPRATNLTEAGRARNRRVEVMLTTK
ncbi:OmpA family protein [Solirhodobacter olei]|uniref:OmpA family protein n=1 Tax=Solirhodobacter olei TaxID=2493082 RepID=UPI000FD89603|nr:OmpA family protein [Solirhodobacter olei]